MEAKTEIPQNTGLSWGAKGLLWYLLSTSENLDINRFVSTFKEGRDATYRIVNELKAAGYVEEYTIRDKGRVVKRGYTIHAVPVQSKNSSHLLESSLDPGKPDRVKPYPVIPDQGKLDPGMPDQAFPKPIKNNTFKKQNLKQNLKEKAAAKVLNTDLANTTKRVEKPAAAFLNSSPSLKITDSSISETLTEDQITVVKARIASLNVSYYAPDKLIHEVMVTLLNPKSFSNAGADFNKKLNTIIKTINDGRWTTPMPCKSLLDAESKKSIAVDQAVTELVNQRSALIGEIQMLKQMVDFHQSSGHQPMAKTMQLQVNQCVARLTALDAHIAIFRASADGCEIQRVAAIG